MTLKIFFLLLLTFGGHSLAAGQSARPFAEVERQVKTQTAGWDGWQPRLVTLFNAERKRLGRRFEAELLKYLEDGNIAKHYWISSFLEAKDYLQGNAPLPYLSLLIKQQALSLLENRSDQDSLMSVVSLSVTAAVLSEQLNFRALAKSYKAKAEDLLAKDEDFGGGFPAMGEEERKLYRAIEYKRVPK
jgi:hypothetical protein